MTQLTDPQHTAGALRDLVAATKTNADRELKAALAAVVLVGTDTETVWTLDEIADAARRLERAAVQAAQATSLLATVDQEMAAGTKPPTFTEWLMANYGDRGLFHDLAIDVKADKCWPKDVTFYYEARNHMLREHDADPEYLDQLACAWSSYELATNS